MTYQEAYQKATGELKAAGIPEPESDAGKLQKNPDSGAASDRGSGIYGI